MRSTLQPDPTASLSSRHRTLLQIVFRTNFFCFNAAELLSTHEQGGQLAQKKRRVVDWKHYKKERVSESVHCYRVSKFFWFRVSDSERSEGGRDKSRVVVLI